MYYYEGGRTKPSREKTPDKTPRTKPSELRQTLCKDICMHVLHKIVGGVRDV